MKLIAPTIESYRLAKEAAIVSAAPTPVDDTGVTPAYWGDCTGYAIDEPAGTDDDQDLIVAIDDGARKGKIRAQDKGTRAKLEARLSAEKTKTKADRQAGKKPGRTKPAGVHTPKVKAAKG